MIKTLSASLLKKFRRLCLRSPLFCVSGITATDLNQRVRTIMSTRSEKLNTHRKLLLTAFVLTVVFIPMAFGLMRIAPQSKPTGPRPSFAVATIKPGSQNIVGIGGYMSEPAFSAEGMTIESLIGYAYHIHYVQGLSIDPRHFWPTSPNLLGGPPWVHTEKFDIVAKADEATAQQWNKLSPLQQKEQLRLMVQSLLAERFKLTLRHETRRIPVYALVAAKGGPKLAPSTSPTAKDQSPWIYDPAGLKGRSVTMSDLADKLWLEQELSSRKVIDRTGLTGNYDLTLRWSPQRDEPPDNGPQAISGPSIFTAIQEQLGLKLESTKAPVDVLVIDHIEHPTPN